MLRACRAVEETGIPALAIVATGFLHQAEATARAMGIPHVQIAEYPGVIPNDSQETFERKLREQVLPAVLAGLTRGADDGAADAEAPEAEPAPGDIVFRGSFDAVQERFHLSQWSDGLPVVPPTPERVARFLEATDRSPDEILGVPLPDLREATVHSVAVNGVMAGCRPEYMPILLAAVESVLDPEFRIEDAGSTPGWEPLVVVTGPSVRRLAFAYEGAAMRVGPQANSSVGRFLRLYFRNVIGFRPPPHGSDKGSIGYTFNVALAENQSAVAEIGWPTYQEDRGYSSETDVVTVQSVVAISPPIYSGGSTPLEHLEYITQILGSTWGPWGYTGLKYGQAHPLLVMSPSVARAFAEAGWTKDAIRDHLSQNVRISARLLERYAMHVEGAEIRLHDYLQRGLVGPEYADSDDPERLVRLFARPERISIVVAGDPGRNQCRAYLNNHEQGPPVSRPFRTPAAN